MHIDFEVKQHWLQSNAAFLRKRKCHKINTMVLLCREAVRLSLDVLVTLATRDVALKEAGEAWKYHQRSKQLKLRVLLREIAK